jgi:uncharacterized protein
VTTFVDTSFLLALLDEDDDRSGDAATLWSRMAADRAALVTTNYVVVETCAVLQRRFGIPAVRRLVRTVLAPVLIEWVTDDAHDLALEALLVAGRRGLSLVDCTSFEVMRGLDVRECLAFDPHFEERGFIIVRP